MKAKFWIVTSLLLVLGLALAGCGPQITAEEIVDKMRETLENTDDAHAIVAVDVSAQGINMSVKAEVWEMSPNKFRAEVLESSQPDTQGMIMVSDGQQGWFYDPAHNQVMVGDVGDLETPLPQEMLAELQDVIQQILDVTDAKLVGEETVVGREAYKLTLTPKDGADSDIFPGGGAPTLWVDKEHWIVLKAEYVADAFGQGSVEIQSFELNLGLDSDLFTFDVPEGVDVVDAKAMEPVPLTLDEAREQAGFQLLVPEYVPEGATLIEVFKLGDSMILRYDHALQVAFTLVEGSEISELAPFEAQASKLTAKTQDVTVRGQSGTALTDEVGGNTLLYWTEDGIIFTIAGRISLDQAIEVAESLQ